MPQLHFGLQILYATFKIFCLIVSEKPKNLNEGKKKHIPLTKYTNKVWGLHPDIK